MVYDPLMPLPSMQIHGLLTAVLVHYIPGWPSWRKITVQAALWCWHLLVF